MVGRNANQTPVTPFRYPSLTQPKSTALGRFHLNGMHDVGSFVRLGNIAQACAGIGAPEVVMHIVYRQLAGAVVVVAF